MDEIELKQLKKSLKFTRTCCLISSILTLALLVAFVLVLTKLSPLVEVAGSVAPAMQNVAKIDMKAANEAIVIFNRESQKIDWAKLSEAIDELDVESINEAVQKLDVDQLNAKLSQLDVDQLNQALINLNEAAKGLESISKSLSGVSSIFR